MFRLAPRKKGESRSPKKKASVQFFVEDVAERQFSWDANSIKQHQRAIMLFYTFTAIITIDPAHINQTEGTTVESQMLTTLVSQINDQRHDDQRSKSMKHLLFRNGFAQGTGGSHGQSPPNCKEMLLESNQKRSNHDVLIGGGIIWYY